MTTYTSYCSRQHKLHMPKYALSLPMRGAEPSRVSTSYPSLISLLVWMSVSLCGYHLHSPLCCRPIGPEIVSLIDLGLLLSCIVPPMILLASMNYVGSQKARI